MFLQRERQIKTLQAQGIDRVVLILWPMKSLLRNYVCSFVLLIGLAQTQALAGNGSISVPDSTNTIEHADAVGRSNSNLIRVLRWNNGLEYELGSSGRMSRLKARHPDSDVEPYHAKVGLKLQLDAVDYQAGSGVADIPDDSGVRRARLYTTGSLFLAFPILYKVEAEWANNDFYVRETYVSLADIPHLQTLKVGFFKAPMTLEGYTGAGDTLFLERAAPIEAFGPGIMYGIQPAGTAAEKHMTWAFGLFADGGQSDVSEASKSLTRGIGRLTWLPMYENTPESTQLIHLGASAQYLYSSQNDIQYRSRPESYFAPRVVDTGPIDAEDALSWGAEFAAERGALSLQSEFLQASVGGHDASAHTFWGCYVAGSWLLTGESRPYNRNTGAFSRVVPCHPFSLRDRTFGAWELVSRFSHLDLNDQDVKGGTLDLATWGVNGYLTSRLKIMIDYSHGYIDHIENDGNLQILESRVQYEF
jgi:phosphate-selective porin OprO and OprP